MGKVIFKTRAKVDNNGNRWISEDDMKTTIMIGLMGGFALGVFFMFLLNLLGV